jgi:signal transduction histidine kinase
MKMQMIGLPNATAVGSRDVGVSLADTPRVFSFLSKCRPGSRLRFILAWMCLLETFGLTALAASGRTPTGPGWHSARPIGSVSAVLADVSVGVLTPMFTHPHHWMIGGVGFAVGAVALVFARRKSRLRKKPVELPEVLAVVEQERKRIAADLHDDLGTRLTEIGLLSTSAHGSGKSAARVMEQMERIQMQADSSVKALDQIVWAINPANDCVSSVASYFCLHAQQFLRDASVGCRLDVAPDLPNELLAPEARHQLFLAFKEALNNVVQHAAASQVRVSIAVRRGTLVISVDDNGRGLPAEPAHAGADGLRNMRQRLERLGGSCHFRSAPQKGLSVRLELPLHAPSRSRLERIRRIARRVKGTSPKSADGGNPPIGPGGRFEGGGLKDGTRFEVRVT